MDGDSVRGERGCRGNLVNVRFSHSDSLFSFKVRTSLRIPAPSIDDGLPLTLYDSLTTNLPLPTMAYTDFSFPPSTPVFPHASVVQAYLRAYADHFQLKPLIDFNTSVRRVRWTPPKWTVQLSTGKIRMFDLLVVANGHHRMPRYPDIPGLSDWLGSGKASHSVYYRNPRSFGNMVLVVGNGPSGQDISTELRSAAKTVIHSIKSAASAVTSQEDEKFRVKGRVREFRPHGQVMFEDGSIEANVDHCILATGYELSFPFFSDDVIRAAMPPLSMPSLPDSLYNSLYHVFPLARHLFPAQTRYPLSSIAFMGLLVRVSPLPLVEAQAHATVHVFAHPEALDVNREAGEVMARHEMLRARFCDEDALSVAKS